MNEYKIIKSRHLKSIENGNAARCFEKKGLDLISFVGIDFTEVDLPRNASKSKNSKSYFFE